MKFDLRALLARLRVLLDGFTTGQKTITALAVLGVAVGGIALAKWEGQTSYAPLFSNLAASDAQAVMSKLDAQHEPYKIAENGTAVLVPQADVYKLRISLSADGLPSNDQTGYALLDKQGMTTSDFQQHVDYQRALEGELAKTIQAIDGVQAASVHLVVPNPDVFATDDSKASASVLIRTTNGQELTPDEVQSVIHLVSSSVSQLSPDDVTVADASGKLLSAPGVAVSGGSDERSEATNAYDTSEAAQLQALVDAAIGAGHSVVRVSADLDLDQKKTTSNTYVAQPGMQPVTTDTTSEVYKGAGSPGSSASGVLGPDDNGTSTGATTSTSGANSSYTKKTVQNQNAVGTLNTQDSSVPGEVTRLSVAVLLDSSAPGGSGASVAKIRQVVAAAAGVSPTRGDTVTVTSMPFSTPVSSFKPPAHTRSLGGLLKTGGLVVALLALFVVALLGTRRTTRTPVPLPPAWDDDAYALPPGDRRRALDAAPALAVSMGSEPTLALPEANRGRSLDDELTELVARQPEDLAHLLRGWLAERRS